MAIPTAREQEIVDQIWSTIDQYMFGIQDELSPEERSGVYQIIGSFGGNMKKVVAFEALLKFVYDKGKAEANW